MPPNLSRRAQRLLECSFSVMDDNGEVEPTGTPPSVMTTLCKKTGNKRWNCWAALRELQEEGLAEVTYVWRAMRVRFVLIGLQIEGGCKVCGSLAKGTGQWCAGCKQRFGRDDRAWQVRALELHDMGLSPRRISVLLNRPMWSGSEIDGRDPRGGAVVPFMIDKGVLGAEWAERLREATRGSSVEDS